MSFITDRLHQKLVHHIVSADKRAENAARKKGRPHNQYALAHMLGAAQRAKAEAEESGGAQEDWLLAVMGNFTATGPMHNFLKKIDPRIKVFVGSWEWDRR